MIPIKVETPESCDQYPVSTKVNIDIWDEVSNPPRLEIPFFRLVEIPVRQGPIKIFLVRMKAHSGRLNGA